MKKIINTTYNEGFIPYGTLQEIVKYFNELIQRYGPDATFVMSDDNECYICVEREETDEEYQKRIAKELKRKATRAAKKIAKEANLTKEDIEFEKKERIEYNRLKKKFEKK